MLNHKQVSLKKGTLHVVESGIGNKTAVLFLHGWPQDWSSWKKILELAGEQVHALAIDLPGIGESTMPNAPSSKRAIADYIHDLVVLTDLQHLTLVGQDVGGQIAYAYLSRYSRELDGAVIMNVVVPGIKPWERVKRNPYIWHFTFHNVADLPETLVAGKQREYFDYFYNLLTAHPEKITDEARDHYAQAYRSRPALKAGFEWYRAFDQDVEDNSGTGHGIVKTPLLYLRGDHESGDISEYVAGFKEAGISNVQSGKLADSGHFAADEQPEEVWKHISTFVLAARVGSD